MKKTRLIIDTNILLLLVIGAVEEGRHIKNSTRLNKFDESDYQTVWKYIGSSVQDIYITPYIATEVSNLIDLNGEAGASAYKIARALFSNFKQIDSLIIDDSMPDSFPIYGITDSSLIRLASEYTILTDDNKLLTPLYTSGPENILPYGRLKELTKQLG